MENNIKILKFLYEKKLKGANFCFIGGSNLGVNKWSNISGYNSYFDLSKGTGVEDIKIINELVIDGYLEKGKSGLTISITNKGIEFYKNEIKPHYKKINYTTIGKIVLGCITVFGTIIGIYYSVLTFYFK